ncbi:hypothetical protein G6O67_001150 [Ophiocordyceps sinensis]|uniref:Uncharacterized protein n=1 Tax=Ophiocordyceps sinensis TaxID=72228 RepID=A0A8H4V8N4_9HYPO|nr:hypothetical protein G6O67_001150 [Ophiocordyceps sinensis]
MAACGETATDAWGTDPVAGDAFDAGAGAGGFNRNEEIGSNAFGDADAFSGNAEDPAAGKCFSCGEMGHRAADCPDPQEQTCRYCKQPGHIVRDCPDKPPMVCDNCGQEGHMKSKCENARKVNRDHVADLTPEDAWAKLERAVVERDMDDTKEAIQEYVKALDGAITYRELQEAMIDHGIKLFLIATERSLVSVFTNMDLQGNMGKRFSISYRFSEQPDRPREADSFPKSREELLARLDEAGEIVNSGRPLCRNCGELGHVAKFCSEEKFEKPDQPKIACNNCGEDGHRIRDCPKPRVDKFACRNCGKSGHRASDCEEPPNPENVECRKCNEKGHFSRDCPQGGPRGCHNCGQEGHMAKDCDQPRNMDRVTCRNCEKTGHVSRECPEPKDWSKVQCSNCQEFGHTKVRCKQPLADFGGDDNGFPSDTAGTADAGTGAGDIAWPANDGSAGHGDASSHDANGWGS